MWMILVVLNDDVLNSDIAAAEQQILVQNLPLFYMF